MPAAEMPARPSKPPTFFFCAPQLHLSMGTRWALNVIVSLSAMFCIRADTPCADQAQQCGALVEEFERQIQDVKALAFKNCFSKPPCVQEKVVFDDCYGKSLQAVRAPFLGTSIARNEFSSAAEKYRSQVENCFHGSEAASKPDFTSLLVDEDAIYARAIYNFEFADRLWELPECGIDKPTLDPQDACLAKGPGIRVFGSGVSRVQEGPLLSNFNSTCVLDPTDISCYRHFLDHDTQFREMLKNRDRALRSCIQGVRAQRKCRMGQSSRIRSCICNAREELETKMQSLLLSCAKSSPLAQLYSTIVDLGGKSEDNRIAAAPPRRSSGKDDLLKDTQDDSTVSTAMSITPGVVLNGQCLCACPGSSPPQLFAGRPQPQAQFSTDPALVYPPIPQTPHMASAGNSDAVVVAQLQHQRLLQQYNELTRQHQQLYQGQAVYQQPQTASASSGPMGTVRSIEGGISDGFERFFNGMPPIRRRDVSRRTPPRF